MGTVLTFLPDRRSVGVCSGPVECQRTRNPLSCSSKTRGRAISISSSRLKAMKTRRPMNGYMTLSATSRTASPLPQPDATVSTMAFYVPDTGRQYCCSNTWQWGWRF